MSVKSAFSETITPMYTEFCGKTFRLFFVCFVLFFVFFLFFFFVVVVVFCLFFLFCFGFQNFNICYDCFIFLFGNMGSHGRINLKRHLLWKYTKNSVPKNACINLGFLPFFFFLCPNMWPYGSTSGKPHLI